MKKLLITGGDNCYCCICGKNGDRLPVLIDTKAKTMEYLPCVGDEFCLGAICRLNDPIIFKGAWAGWKLERIDKLCRTRGYIPQHKTTYKFSNGIDEIKVQPKGNKWGKDGEFPGFGVMLDRIETNDKIIYELVDKYESPKKTGWKFIIRKTERS